MDFLTEESPAKVLGLLGVAFTSMFFMFAVTVTNANFQQTEKPFPDVFSPNKVVAFLDYTANDYSRFVAANLVEPAQNDYAIYQYNLKYVFDEASPAILAYTGLTPLADANYNSAAQARPQVAGASTQAVTSKYYPEPSSWLDINTIYRLLSMK
jgi:hypothetical protein